MQKASKGSNINTDLVEYVPKTVVKKEVIKKLNMLILLLTVSSIYLFLSQIKYQIHTTLQYHQLIVTELIYQHLLVQTNM